MIGWIRSGYELTSVKSFTEQVCAEHVNTSIEMIVLTPLCVHGAPRPKAKFSMSRFGFGPDSSGCPLSSEVVMIPASEGGRGGQPGAGASQCAVFLTRARAQDEQFCRAAWRGSFGSRASRHRCGLCICTCSGRRGGPRRSCAPQNPADLPRVSGHFVT